MKLKYTVVIAICMMVLTGCDGYHTERIRDGRTYVTIKESDHKYRIDAGFNRSKTRELARIIDEELDSSESIDAENLNGTIFPDDEMKIYIRLRPGRLRIRFDKNENDATAYTKIKHLEDKIKATLHPDQVEPR